MGIFRVTLEIGDARGERYQEVPSLVDAGAAYTWVPGSVLEGLGLEPSFRLSFILADSRIIERDVTETRVRLNGQVRTTIVVFGDEASEAPMGACTLEGFGLSVDPINRVLVPIPRFPMATHFAIGCGDREMCEGSCGRR